MKAQRLRVRFRVEKEAAELPPREMSRAWEEAAINGGLPLAYSEGRRRTPQVSRKSETRAPWRTACGAPVQA